MANTLKFFGSFEGKYIPNTNPIWAFTMGDLTTSGWLSEKANNLEELIQNVDSKNSMLAANQVVKAFGLGDLAQLQIAVPTYGSHINNFNLKPGRKESDLKIFATDNEKVVATFIAFFAEVKKNMFSSSSNFAANFQVCTLSINSFVHRRGIA